jgi:xanthine dehydrogenase YagR molybdenum-binding subunit
MSPVTGEPLSRVDGLAKVTGAARYAAEFARPELAHGVIIQSTIAKGRITEIDTSAAERAPGVLAVTTHRNAPELPTRSSIRHRRSIPRSACSCRCCTTTWSAITGSISGW